jgi:hypothetical protein
VLVDAVEHESVGAHGSEERRLVDLPWQSQRDEQPDGSAAHDGVGNPSTEFARATLVASPRAVRSGSSADDSTYTSVEDQIQSLTARRDFLAANIRAALEDAAFPGDALNRHQARSYIRQARELINEAEDLASSW